MPTLEYDDASIYYEVHGSGFPILAFAPGALMSTIEVWNRAPVNPVKLFGPAFQVIVMDQRNAGGQSRATIRADDGWQTFLADHVALLDHLQINRCHLYGQCIGGPFILSMLKAYPDRIASAVITQPIGRVGALPPGRSPSFTSWVGTLKDHPEADEQVLDSFYANLYAPGFAYSVDREFLRRCETPCLVLAGNDAAHPFAIAEEIARLLPHSEFIAERREEQALAGATKRMTQFLTERTPIATDR